MTASVKCSVYIATSVDGFIARSDGDVSWLERSEYAGVPVPGLTYEAFIASVDAIVLGRASFEKVLSFELPAWPYPMPAVVLSHRPLEVPARLEGVVRHDAGEPDEIVARLAAEGKRHLYIDGGVTIRRFLRAGLIDEITMTQVPVLLGSGIPLFGDDVEVALELIEVTSASNGFVQTRYRVGRCLEFGRVYSK